MENKHFVSMIYHPYGSIYAFKKNDKFFISMDADNYNESYEISEEFFLACLKEFEGNPRNWSL